jgi:hypothetical protein
MYFDSMYINLLSLLLFFYSTNACTLIENTLTTYIQITVLKVCDVFCINKLLKLLKLVKKTLHVSIG